MCGQVHACLSQRRSGSEEANREEGEGEVGGRRRTRRDEAVHGQRGQT